MSRRSGAPVRMWPGRPGVRLGSGPPRAGTLGLERDARVADRRLRRVAGLARRRARGLRGHGRHSLLGRIRARVGLASGSARSRRPGYGPRVRASRVRGRVWPRLPPLPRGVRREVTRVARCHLPRRSPRVRLGSRDERQRRRWFRRARPYGRSSVHAGTPGARPCPAFGALQWIAAVHGPLVVERPIWQPFCSRAGRRRGHRRYGRTARAPPLGHPTARRLRACSRLGGAAIPGGTHVSHQLAPLVDRTGAVADDTC